MEQKKNLYDELANQQPNTYEESVAKSQNPNGITEPDGTIREAEAKDAQLNTGAGAEAAVGTQYSWNKQGADKAQKQYQSDVLQQKDKLLTQAQQTANNTVNYQTQADMMKYQNNQNAEKVGWTGGYVLDQNKQTEYLKASIQAQMYGAMELQKYGYDSALAAARLSYDLNQQEYARQYYNDAVSAALSEAQLTGTYFSAETKDMMSQYSTALQKLSDKSISEDEKNKADSIIKTIEKWFSTNDISPAGVKTMAAYQYEADQAFQWNQELYIRYNTAIKTVKEDQKNNVTLFIKVDANGNPIFDGMDVETLDFSTVSANELASYIKPEDSEVLNKAAQQQVQAYINYLYKDALNQAQKQVEDNQGNVSTTTDLNKKEYKEAIAKMESIMNGINSKCGAGTIADPRSTTSEGGSGGSGNPENGPENPEREYQHVGDWTNDTVIKVTGDNGEIELTKKLTYMNWNDPNKILSDTTKDLFPKAVLDITYSSLPSGWQKIFKKQLNISTNFAVEVLPTTLINNKTIDGYIGSFNEYGVYPNTSMTGLGGQIEGFLRTYYEHTTGTTIKVGSMIVLGDHVLVWNGDDGKGLKNAFGSSSVPEARWLDLGKKTESGAGQINTIKNLVDL